MKCPNCGHTLEAVDLSDHGLSQAYGCAKCGGCWIDKNALEAAHAGVWGNLQAMGVEVEEALSETICPRCQVQCAEVSPADHLELSIDRCPSCHGLWLDRGELEPLYEVVTAYAEGHGTLAEKPADWSALRWITYRLARAWQENPAGYGAE